MSTMRRLISLLLITLLSACVTQQAPVPQENYFRLDATVSQHNSADATAPRLANGLLMVEELRSDGVHAERALIYSDDPSHHKLNLYNYDFWSDPPTRLIQSYLVQRLRAAAVAPLVMRYDINDNAQAYVGGQLERMVQLIDGEQARVVVAIELRLSLAGEQQPRLLQRYSAEIPVRGTAPADTIAGYEQALNRIITHFIADARGATRAAAPTGTVR